MGCQKGLAGHMLCRWMLGQMDKGMNGGAEKWMDGKGVGPSVP
jgi:hypothetical protein